MSLTDQQWKLLEQKGPRHSARWLAVRLGLTAAEVRAAALERGIAIGAARRRRRASESRSARRDALSERPKASPSTRGKSRRSRNNPSDSGDRLRRAASAGSGAPASADVPARALPVGPGMPVARGRLAWLTKPAPSLLAVFAFALLLRAIHLGEVHDTPLFLKLQTDPFEYHHWALRILEGDWIGRNDPVFYQGPLYPYFLAVIYRISGPSPFAASVVQVVLSAATAGMIALLGRRLLGPSAGLVAGLLVAAYGIVIFHTSMLLGATVIIFLHVAMLVALESAIRRRTLWRWAATGLLLGLGAAARGTVLLFAPIALLVAVRQHGARQWRAWAAPAACLVAGTLVAIAPVTLHNRIVGGDSSLLTWNAGTNLFIGNNANSDGIYLRDAVYRGRPMGLSVRDQRMSYPEVAKSELGRDDLRPSEISAFWVARTIDEIRESPGRWLGLVANKLRYLLNGYEVPNVRNFYFSERFSRLLRLPLVSYGLVLPLALVGLLLARTIWRRHPWLPGYVAAHALSLLVFFVNDRYRLVMAPVLCIPAAYALVWIAGRLRARDWARGALAAGGWAAALLVATAPVTHTSMRADLLNLGNAYRDLGQLDRAIESYDEAIELSPGFYYAHFKKAQVLSRLGRKDEAKALAKQALSMARRSGDTLNVRRIRGLLESLGERGSSSGRSDSSCEPKKPAAQNDRCGDRPPAQNDRCGDRPPAQNDRCGDRPPAQNDRCGDRPPAQNDRCGDGR